MLLRKRSDANTGKGTLNVLRLTESIEADSLGSKGDMVKPSYSAASPRSDRGFAAPLSPVALLGADGDLATLQLRDQVSAQSSEEWAGAHVKLDRSPGQGSRVPKSSASQALDAVDAAVEAAASQIVHKAMRFISMDDDPRPAAAAATATAKPLFKFDSSSFLDKGLGAINGMGKMMEGLAVTLDSVIGQAFDDWGTPIKAGSAPRRRTPGSRAAPAGGERQARRPSPQKAAPETCTPADAWGDFDIANKENGSARSAAARPQRRASRGPLAPTPTNLAVDVGKEEEEEDTQQWRRRAQVLQRELQKLKAQHEEYARAKEQYDKLQSAPGANSLGLAAGDADPAGADPLAAQQVKQQMEALLHEKARLAQENDRLLRENNGLQELLEFTIRQHADVAGEDELFGGGGWEEEEQEFATPEGSGFDRDEDGRFDQQ